MGLASPETRARPRPGQRPKPRRRTRDAGTEGLPGYSEQTCKVSLGARAQGVVGGQSGRKTVLGQRTNFGEAGRDTAARPQGTPGQSPHSRDWVLRVGHSTQHLGTPPPVGATSAPESRAPRARGGCPIPCAPGRAARGGAAAGPTNAARMRRLFSSVQRSERTPGCARSSSAAASTQPAVQAAQASNAPRPHLPHRPRHRVLPRAPAARAMASPAVPRPAAAPRARLAAPRSARLGGGGAARGERRLGAGSRAPGGSWGWRVSAAASGAPARAPGEEGVGSPLPGTPAGRPAPHAAPATFSTFSSFAPFSQEDQLPS